MKKVYLYCISLLAVVSCSQDDFGGFSDISPDRISGYRFVLTADGDNSRATTDNNFKTVFTEGDAVGIFVVSRPESGGGVTIASTGNYADNHKLIYSDGNWIIDNEIAYPQAGTVLDFYAYYPYSENADPTAIAYDASKSMYDLMVAKTTDVTAADETVHLTFSHQLSLLDANITAGAGSSATVTGLVPAASFNLGAIGTDEFMTLGQETADVAMTVVDKKHFRAYLPAQDSKNASITLSSTGGTQDYKPANEKMILGTAYKYNITSTLISLGDLPNCYIVKPGETLTFPVLKGYEVWRQVKWINSGNLRNNNAPSATLIWQDRPSLIPADGITFNLDENQADQSTITVKTTAGISGNAVVALTLGSDPVWCWHIWVTDFDPEQNTRGVDNNGDGIIDYEFMDRNLGATTADVTMPGSVGLYYQGYNNKPWPGLTDKFPTDGVSIADVPIYDINSNPADKIEAQTVWNPDQGQAMRRVLTQPGIFVGATGEPYSWLTSDTNASLLHGTNFWHDGDNNEKGIFDPSPEGWMVPIYENELSPWQTVHDNKTWIEFGQQYPSGGRIRFDGKFGDSTYCMLWTASPYYIKLMGFSCNGNNTDNVTNYSIANALNVRCVKIK